MLMRTRVCCCVHARLRLRRDSSQMNAASPHPRTHAASSCACMRMHSACVRLPCDSCLPSLACVRSPVHACICVRFDGRASAAARNADCPALDSDRSRRPRRRPRSGRVYRRLRRLPNEEQSLLPLRFGDRRRPLRRRHRRPLTPPPVRVHQRASRRRSSTNTGSIIADSALVYSANARHPNTYRHRQRRPPPSAPPLLYASRLGARRT